VQHVEETFEWDEVSVYRKIGLQRFWHYAFSRVVIRKIDAHSLASIIRA
jgi:hypothetical protein